MGVIIRQSVKSSLVSFIGIGVGVINLLFIYTQDFQAYGFLQILLTSAFMLSPIASLGIRGVITRFFPRFRQDKASRAAFFTFSLAVLVGGGILLAFIGRLLILPLLLELAGDNNNFILFARYAPYIYWLTVFQMLIEITDGYVQNFLRITVPTIITNLLPKFMTGALIYLTVTDDWNYVDISKAAVAMNAIIAGCLLLYLGWLKELRLNFNWSLYFTPQLRRELFIYGSYAIIGIIGTKIALQIDTVSLGAYADEEAAGIYQIIVFIAAVIDVPLRAMSKITSPIVAQAMDRKDYTKAGDLYQRSALALTFTGSAVFCLLYVSLPDIFELTNRPYAFVGGLLTFTLIGIAKLTNAMTSINNQLVQYSDLFRLNLYLVVGLALMNAFFNWLFIAHYSWGIIGAALATFLALTIYNICRSLLVYQRFGLHPLRWSLALPVLAALTLMLLGIWLPLSFHPIVNILLRSGIVGLAFMGLGYFAPAFREIRQLFGLQ